MSTVEQMVSNEITGPITRSLVTIYDVAEMACVSPATVSRILAGFVVYKPETKRRVLRAVQTLGYVPNHQAQKLASMRVSRGR
jgi:DNA-binding LacI/PurR family transcriptional regulator